MSVPSEAGGEIVVDYTLKIFFVQELLKDNLKVNRSAVQ